MYKWWDSIVRFFRNLRAIPGILASINFLQYKLEKLEDSVIKQGHSLQAELMNAQEALDGYDLPVLIKKMDELDWRQLAMLKVLLSNALLNPQHCAGIISITNQDEYLEWSRSHQQSVSPEVRKYFEDILLRGDHKEPG